MTQFLRYVWASPTTLVGLVLVALSYMTGGKVRVVRGAVEASGGWLIPPIFMRGFPWIGPVGAMTFGHAIIGLDEGALDSARDHEHVHVRQCERWGPLILLAYPVASLVAVCCGRHIYRDNYFEREAYGTN